MSKVNRADIIATKIKALWALKDRKAWPRDPDVAGELIRQYVNALTKVPDTELEILLDSFFGHDQVKMPEPHEIRSKWLGVERAERGREDAEAIIKERESIESEMRDTLNMGARTSYSRDVVILMQKKMRLPEYYAELERISVAHNVSCPTIELMMLTCPQWMREKYEVAA